MFAWFKKKEIFKELIMLSVFVEDIYPSERSSGKFFFVFEPSSMVKMGPHHRFPLKVRLSENITIVPLIAWPWVPWFKANKVHRK